ncbi:hypothetical protein IV203_037502 [Nitzschia inconspicua]|uniref:Uncharacterized protein n=1 Tax=Nitzschia inconspicua TaxID=303405 RepID=A0A9K3PYT4_9STRA|nr:hypothetical protein IV203_037502 [Nitzschia inconspicua]
MEDLRFLRTKHGETSFGGKKVLQCPSCDAKVSSEDLTIERLKRYFGDAFLSENENLWSTSKYLSKFQLLMEMELLHAMLPPKCQSRVNPQGVNQPSRLKFIVTALRNLHRSDHCNGCFKKGAECQMKIPCFPCTEMLVLFDDKLTNWFDWKGNDVSWPMSICVPKRAHVDAFVNVHNDLASILFGCNTNVIAGVDGGGIMYCTCYVSKNSEKEDNKHFAAAAKQMVKKMQQKVMERMEVGDRDNEEDTSSIGIRGMIGATFMATKVQKVAAPMASYLIRNGARFQFSHDFSYVNIRSFFKEVYEDLEISADEEGCVFYNSSVANYLCRPKELEDVCLYDFLAKYSTLCIEAGNLRFHVRGTRKEYQAMEKKKTGYHLCICGRSSCTRQNQEVP